MKKLFYPVAAFFFGASMMLSSCAEQPKAEAPVYLFSYFVGNGETGLHLAASKDGKVWENIKNGESLLRPQIGKDKLMRDPSICQGADGTFHMVWTSGWWDQGIGYASSTDLVNWSEQKNIPVMEHEPETKNTWAPELYFDDADGTFYIIWASTIPGKHKEVETSEREAGLNHRQYYVTTKDFQTFSETQMFFDPDFSVIDGAIIKKDSKYWFITKNENSKPAEKNLRICFTDCMSKGFPTEVSENISGKSWVEGPSPLLVGDSVYVYFDKYTERKYGAIRSADGVNWEDVSDMVSFPKGVRHGTAFTVTESFFNNLVTTLNN